MFNLQDHPIIRNLERTGYPDGKEPKVPICPECGNEAEQFYKDTLGYIIGCDQCIEVVDAWMEESEDE